MHLSDAVSMTTRILEGFVSSFEIIIVEDGSTDGTDVIAARLASNYDYVEYLHSDVRQGFGNAVMRGFRVASGDVLCFIDVDLATDMAHLKELIEAVGLEGYDFSIGSRMMFKSDAKRPFSRVVLSKSFNLLARIVLRSNLYDHQCGFKAFKRESLFELLDLIEDEHWFWDTEFLVYAQRGGYRVKEFPVVWRHSGVTRVNVLRDSVLMGYGIFSLWWRLFISPMFGHKRFLWLHRLFESS